MYHNNNNKNKIKSNQKQSNACVKGGSAIKFCKPVSLPQTILLCRARPAVLMFVTIHRTSTLYPDNKKKGFRKRFGLILALHLRVLALVSWQACVPHLDRQQPSVQKAWEWICGNFTGGKMTEVTCRGGTRSVAYLGSLRDLSFNRLATFSLHCQDSSRSKEVAET